MQYQILGKYRIDTVIGKGAMGVIYEAFDSALQRKVAIKTMTSELMNDPQLRKRFYQEARAAGNLRHPNIITIFDLGEEDKIPYIVMELLQGTDLKSLMQKEQTWPYWKVINIAVQSGKGLNFAHQHGIVHRDIKPANIFIGNDGMVKILDFGVAHVLSSTMTQAGMLLGSLGYMAPEQIVGQKVDGRADQYSIGVIMYELITGTKPFMEKDIPSTIKAILEKPPVPLRRVREDCPEALETAVLTCLQKDREKRFPNLDDAAKALTLIYDALAQNDTNRLQSTWISSADLTPPPPKPKEGMDTKSWKSLNELLSYSRSLQQSGNVTEAFSVMKDHYKVYQKDHEFQTFFRQLRVEKETMDKRGLFQKHYQEALRLLEEDNFQLARLEMETLLRIDSSSPLISQLEQQISRQESGWHIQDWFEEGEKLVNLRDWPGLANHIPKGEKQFGGAKDFQARRDQLIEHIERAEIDTLLEQLAPLEGEQKWEEAVELLRPFLRKYSRNRKLVEKYNFIMAQKLERDRNQSMRQFIQEQLKIVNTLFKSQQYEQAKKYLIVLLEKFPGTPEFEEHMIQVENRLDMQRSIKEIRQYIENQDVNKATELLEILGDAYQGEPQIEILRHELENLRMTVDSNSLLETSHSRLANAVRLAGKGAFDKALEIIRELMAENPEHTFLYTNYLKIRTEKEAHERDELLRGLQEMDELEKKGELFLALEKAQILHQHFPREETLVNLYGALRARFTSLQQDRIQKAIARGALQEASALLAANLKLLPSEEVFLELQDNLDMENQKIEFIQSEMAKAKAALKENRVDEALEIVNSLIPLNPNNLELKEFLKDIIYRKTRAL